MKLAIILLSSALLMATWSRADEGSGENTDDEMSHDTGNNEGGEDGGDAGDCSNAPPRIAGGIVDVLTAEQSPTGVAMALISCDEGRNLTGSNIVLCQNGDWVRPLPICAAGAGSISGRFGVAGTGNPVGSSTTSPCTVQDTIDTDNCQEVIRYRWAGNKCSGIVACSDTRLGQSSNVFAVKANCVSTCTPKASSTGGQRKFGGSRGPKCIRGVDEAHSSCKDDDSSLLNTITFYVAQVLSPHNVFRQLPNPKPATASQTLVELQWSDDLAITAERQAAQCSIMQESNWEERKLPNFGYIGQNVYFGRGRIQPSWAQAISGWGVQRKNYEYGRGAKNGDNDSVKEYVQLMWGPARYVGCGIAQCVGTTNDFVMICNYAGERGNSEGGPRVTAAVRNPYARPYQAINPE